MLARLVRSAMALALAGTLLSSAAQAQLNLLTTRSVYPAGAPLVVEHKFTNSTAEAITWDTQNRRQSISYALKRFDLDDPIQQAPFQARLNGTTLLDLRRIDFQQPDAGVLGGTVGPFKSRTLGSTLGYTMPVDLLRGYKPTYGASPVYTTAANQSFMLAEGDRLEILTPGHYQLTVAINRTTIAGFKYGSSGGFLTDSMPIEIAP